MVDAVRKNSSFESKRALPTALPPVTAVYCQSCSGWASADCSGLWLGMVQGRVGEDTASGTQKGELLRKRGRGLAGKPPRAATGGTEKLG